MFVKLQTLFVLVVLALSGNAHALVVNGTYTKSVAVNGGGVLTYTEIAKTTYPCWGWPNFPEPTPSFTFTSFSYSSATVENPNAVASEYYVEAQPCNLNNGVTP